MRRPIRIGPVLQPVLLLAHRPSYPALRELASQGWVMWLPDNPAAVSWRPLAKRAAVADVWAPDALRSATLLALRRDGVEVLAEHDRSP